MSIKDLFGKKSQKLLSATTLKEVGDETESEDYVKEVVEEKYKFVPDVDFSDPNNFIRYGSAEKYYSDIINKIQSTYPYDGSLAEKLGWHNDNTDFENYFFENQYPRTTGYVRIGESYGSVVTNAHGYDTPNTQEYIFFKGGPNAADDATKKTLKTIFKEANIYDPDENRESNLELSGEDGTTVEFWLKKPNFSGSQKQVIFDLWNSASFGNINYGRFRIDVTGSSQFFVEYMSGSDGIFYTPLGQNLDFTGSADWNHYTFSIINSGSQLSLKLYVNGDLNDSSVTGSDIGLVTGSMLGWIGALGTSVSGANGTEGDGKLSGSLDEFRYWKVKQTDKKTKKYWFRQVGGGTNTDVANTDLGVYYKFNEGITGDTTTDSVVLDYSGRITNGDWTGYTTTSRVSSSAMVEASASLSEFEDPIIYTNHPDYITTANDMASTGSLYDRENSANIYNSFPSWMIDEDEISGEPLKNLIQIMGQFFDDLHLKVEALPGIRDAVYRSGKPLPFAARLLESVGFTAPELFTQASIVEDILSMDDERVFEEKLFNVKNHIYQNIYNNLIYIYRSKGTEKAVRNLIRCFGVDDELIKVNLYSDNADYKFEDSYRYTSVKKNYIDFNDVDRFDSIVYQMSASDNSNSVSFLSGNLNSGLVGTTFECEAIFPKKFEIANELFFRTDFLSCSLFGMHEADASNPASTTFFGSDRAELSVFAIRPEEESKDVRFMLTSSYFGVELTSSTFRDVYDNEKWNFAVRFKSDKAPLADGVTGTSGSNYVLEFYGVNAVLDTIQNSFLLTASVTNDVADGHFAADKRIYVGAHRDNMTGSVLTGAGANNEHFSDAKISGVRYWFSYLKDEVINEHAKDATNFGVEHPYRNVESFLVDALGGTFVPNIETLALHWDFDTVTGSDNGTGLPPANTTDAQFVVEDYSSGSANLSERFSFIGGITRNQHTGRGDLFPRQSTDVVQREYVFAAKKRLPETLNSDDLIQIVSQDDEIFTRESRPVNHYFAVEKSMYQNISEEMLKWFSTVADFSNLIGKPSLRYEQHYNDLEKLRNLFFQRVENTPDFERFVDFYKWIDDAIVKMALQLVPGSSNFLNTLSNVVESHILERNKYWNKLPTIEFKLGDPEGAAETINIHKYNWKTGHAPVSLNENESCVWWRERAERDANTGVDLNSDREKILDVTLSALNRRFTTVYDLQTDAVVVIDVRPRNVAVTKQVTRFGSAGYLLLEGSDLDEEDCND